jgi:hypothetical protein
MVSDDTDIDVVEKENPPYILVALSTSLTGQAARDASQTCDFFNNPPIGKHSILNGTLLLYLLS